MKTSRKVALVICTAMCLCGLGTVLAGVVGQKPAPKPVAPASMAASVTPAPLPTGEAAQPPPPQETVDSDDQVDGNPGGFCATSRVGKAIQINGVTYICKGPKPYRWRR